MAQVDTFSSLKESVLERIRRDIVMRVLPPGATIRDSELAVRYGVSTSPVREALVQLAADRLIEMPPNRPKRVGPMDRKTTRDFFAVYKLVALAGFTWGAPKIGPAQIARMQAVHDELVEIFPDGDRYLIARQARGFFVPVYEASSNAELIHMITRRFNWIDRLLVLISAFETDAVLGSFSAIIAAFLRGDFSTAIRIHYDLLHQMEADIAHMKL